MYTELGTERSSSILESKRVRIAGVILGATLLVVLGALSMRGGSSQAMGASFQHAEAIAKANSAATPFSQLPDESSLETPQGWVVESDEPVEGAPTQDLEDGSDDELEQDEAEADDDIDSAMDFEEDKNGEKYVAEFDPEVIVTEDGEQQTEGNELAIAEDGKKYKRRCYKNLKACGARKACNKKCIKKCRPYALRKCTFKKFCRCYCKYYGKIKKAKKCVIYKRKTCITGTIYKCKRACKKYCKRIPRCYCCPRSHIAEKCYRNCKKYLYTAKCGYCRCKLTKCVRTCRFVCKKKYY